MELSHESKRSLVYEQVQKAYPEDTRTGKYAYIESMFDSEVVFKYAGDFWKAAYQIENGVAKLGKAEKVMKRVSFEPTLFTFSEEAADGAPAEFTEGEYIVKTGKIFEAGDYPDKGVSFTEKDLEAAAASFTPVPNDLEHKQTILDGKLGGLRKVWKKGSALYGQVAIPKWLNDLMGKKKEPLKVSLAFDANKKIVGNALTLRPRIEDAAVFAAFSEAGSGEGEPNMKAKASDVINRIFAAMGLSANQEVDLTHAFSQDNGQVTPAAPAITQPSVPATPPAADGSEFSRQLEELKAQTANAAKASLSAMARQFANAQVSAGKCLPSQADSVASMFATAATLDNGGVVTFSQDGTIKTGDKVKELTEFFEAAPKLPNHGERIEARALEFSQSEPDQNRIKQLMNLTPMGRKAAEKA